MQRHFLLAYSIIIMLITISCYTRKEGCLDTYSTNLDVTADDPCEDGCCLYPALNLSIEKKVGDSLFRISDTLFNSLGQKFRIIDLRCYFSDFSLYQNQGTQTKTLEFITNSDNSVIVPDDMKIWRWADESFSPGSVKAFGSFDSLIFYLGLNSIVANTTFDNLPSGHVLLNENKLKDGTGKIAFMTLQCIRYLTKTDTISINIQKTDFPFKLKITKSVTTQKGDNIGFSLKADYLVLMKDADLNLSISAIESKVRSNISSFISVN